MHKPRNKDRGATLVEYAMVVALVMVVCITGVQKIRDSGDDELAADGDRVGSVSDNAYYPTGATTSTTTATSSTTTTSLPGQQVQPSSITATPAAVDSGGGGSKWIAGATITVTTVNPPTTGIAGLTVTGQWTFPAGGSPETRTCSTGPTGSCSVQSNDINDNKPDAVFTVTSITGPGFFWTPGAGDVTTISVPCSPPLNASCD